MGLSERLASVNRRIAASCERAGRSPSEVTLVGVTKTVAPAVVESAIRAGLRDLGENRVQEAATKMAELREATDLNNVRWHLIGHLQSNKARRAIEIFDLIESVDSLKLAERLNDLAGEVGKRLPVLIEVNLGGEESKSGIGADDVFHLCEKAGRLSNLEIEGLMTVPPFFDDPEEVRPFFRRLRELRDESRRMGIVDRGFKELSMGMSNDFEAAIEEGATFIRIGTAIFGERPR